MDKRKFWTLCAFYPLFVLVLGCSSGPTESVGPGDGASGEIREVVHYQEDLTRNLVHATAACPNGDVWFGYGSNGGGITRYRAGEWTSYSREDGLRRTGVHALACDSRSVIWIGHGVSGGGLTSYDGSNWRTYTTGDGIASNYIQAIAVAGEGSLWLAFGNNGRGVDRVSFE